MPHADLINNGHNAVNQILLESIINDWLHLCKCRAIALGVLGGTEQWAPLGNWGSNGTENGPKHPHLAH